MYEWKHYSSLQNFLTWVELGHFLMLGVSPLQICEKNLSSGQKKSHQVGSEPISSKPPKPGPTRKARRPWPGPEVPGTALLFRSRGRTGQGPSLGSGQLMKILLPKLVTCSKSSGQNIKARFRSEPLLVRGLSLNDPVSVWLQISCRSTSI